MIENLNLSATIIKNLTMTGVIVLAALFARVVAEFVIKAIIKRFEDENHEENSALEQRVYTLSSIIKNAVNIGIIGVSLLTIMSQWGVDIAPILAGAGILGLAVGFGSQAVVKDVVTGFLILLENSYNVGDEVTISGKTGRVDKMNLRTTILIDKNGNKHTVPNSSIGIITNISHMKEIEE